MFNRMFIKVVTQGKSYKSSVKTNKKRVLGMAISAAN